MFATTPKTDMTDLPRKAPNDAVRELLATIPGMMLNATNDAGIAARLENRPGRYDLHLTGGAADVRSALAEAAAAIAKTSIDLGVETDEVGGEPVAMASRLHLAPSPAREEQDTTVLEIGTVFQSWGVEPGSDTQQKD